MCGRYQVHTPIEQIAREFDAVLTQEAAELAPRYNVAPSLEVPAVRLRDDARELTALTWGLVPSWSKDLSGTKPINARAETVFDSPLFRTAIRRRRCLLPADGFYEWQERPGGKQPWHVGMLDASLVRPWRDLGVLEERGQGPGELRDCRDRCQRAGRRDPSADAGDRRACRPRPVVRSEFERPRRDRRAASCPIRRMKCVRIRCRCGSTTRRTRELSSSSLSRTHKSGDLVLATRAEERCSRPSPPACPKRPRT